MKRFLTFLALCCLMAAGAWAQTQVQTVKTSPAADGTTYYLYTLESGNNARKYWAAPGGVLNAQSSTSTQWYFETTGTDGVYHVRDYGTGKYLYYTTGNSGDAVNLGDTKSEWTVQVHSGGQQVTLSPNGKDDIGINYSSNHIVYAASKTGNANSWWKMCEYEGTAPVEKDFKYVLTDNHGNTYEGTYKSTISHGQPQLTGVHGYSLSNETWEEVTDGSADVLYKATINFPFNVSKDGRDGHYNNIATFNDNQWLWEAVDDDVKVNKGGTATTDNFKWAIIPTLTDNAFTFQIKNVGTGKMIAVKKEGSNHNQGAIKLEDASTTNFVCVEGNGSSNYAFKVVEDATQYLSQHSSSTTTQFIGVHNAKHNGINLKFTSIDEIITPAVVVPHTLNPEDKATVESLEKVSVKFSVAEGAYYPYMASDYAKPEVLPYFSKGGTNVMASLAKNSEDEGLFEITPSETLSDGEWTLTIPEGAFWIWNGDLDAEAQPVAEITATYTVATTAVDEITTFNYGWLPGTATPDAQWKAWTGDVPEGISTQNEFCTADNLYVITKRYEFTNEQNNLQVTFQHQGGNQRTEIVGVDVIAEDGTVYSDYHHGYTGTSKEANVYTINNIPAGTYTVRYITTKHWGTEQNTQIKGYITPVVTEPTPQITDLTQLSNDKAYVLICQRGQLSTSDGQLVPVVAGDDKYTAEANKFAIIKSGDKYYLWSVAEEGYVRTDKAITDHRLAAQEITLTHQSDNTFLLKIAGNGVNMQNSASGIIVNTYTTPDAGNKYAIYEVDDFADAETAIAAIPGWAPTAGKVYTIMAHFDATNQDALYLSNDGSENLQFATASTSSQSYWIAGDTNNADYPWNFQSGYGDNRFLSGDTGLSTSGFNFNSHAIDATYSYLQANLSGIGKRYVGTWNAGHNPVGFGKWGGAYGNGHSHSNWTTYYAIEEVPGALVYHVMSNEAEGGVTVNMTGYNGAATLNDGAVVVFTTVPAAEDIEAVSIDGVEATVDIDTDNKTITVTYKKTYTVHISDAPDASAKLIFNGEQYEDDAVFKAVGLTTDQLTATYYDGMYARISIDGNVINVAYLNKEVLAVKSVGARTETILPGKWYVMTNLRNGETPVYDNEGKLWRDNRNVSTILPQNTKFEGVADKYLMRFIEDSEHEGLYTIQFADGNYWNGTTSSSSEFAKYYVYPATHSGQNIQGFAINHSNDGTAYNERMDNNGQNVQISYYQSGKYTSGTNNVWFLYPVELDEAFEVVFILGDPVNEEHHVTAIEGTTPLLPIDVPEYVDATYVPELAPATESVTYNVSFDYNDLMPFVPGQQTTVDIDVRNHYYFHVEKRTITIDNVEQEIWVPCISPKAPTFDDDAAYIWVMEGDWYNGFRFHNDQIAKEAAGGDGTACHITFHHHEILSNTMEKMEGMKGETSLTEKTYTLVSNDAWNEKQTRATLTADATDTHSYFDLIYAPVEDQNPNYRKDHPDWQFRIHGTATGFKNKRAGWYLNFRDYKDTGDNPDSLLCIYNGGAAYADRASSFTFHKNEVCTEDDRQAVLAMIDAIEKGAVGAILDKTAQEYQDLLTLKGRIEDTTIGCTRALFDVYTEKLVKYAGEKKTPADGEAYRLAVRTKEGRNFYLKDDGTYTTDSLDAAIYVLGSSADGTKKILAGNNNEDLYYFRNGGLTQDVYAEGDCDFNYELMAGKETVADVLDATGAAKYATVCLTDGNGKVATMTSPDKATATGTCTWEEPQEVVYMNDELSSAIVMEPVPYPYTHPNFAHGTSDGRQGGFATIWLPFPMHFPDGIEVYKGTYMRDAKTGEICPYLMLTEVDKGNVTAAGGYLLYNAEQTESKMKQLVLPAPANPEDLREEEDAAFIGSTENPGQTGDATLWTEKFVNEYGDDFIPYVLADKSKDGKGIGFFRYTGATYPKGKAIYLSPKPAQGEAPAECIMFSFDDVIEAIESLHGHAITSEIYDLQGHRLNKVQKGQINVINGTKVMFK